MSAAHTLSSFIPTAQPEKMALIADAANLVDLTLNPLEISPPPTDAEVIDSLNRAAAKLKQVAVDDPALRADFNRLATEFGALAAGGAAARAGAERLLLPGFTTTLDQIRNWLQPQPVSLSLIHI